jgi:hypothetical protein
MTSTDIARHRLINQQLEGTKYKTAGELVSWFGAVQSQDYEMAKWAIGIRLSVTAAEVEKAINRGEIIRTHILRPTWHFVSSADIRWMLMLTAPRIKASLNSNWRKMELDEKLFSRSHRIMQNALSGNNFLSREELASRLKQKGIITGNPMRTAHFMLRAELDGIVCNGPKRDKIFTYALLDEKAPATKKLEKEEALGELAQRYFSSHGCATLNDFCWWSGIGVRDAKTGLDLIKNGLDSVIFNSKPYWFRPNPLPPENFERIHFLPAFDEFLISYKDRSPSLSSKLTGKAITKNGIFRPLIIMNGQVAGIWKKTQKDGHILIHPYIQGPRNTIKKHDLQEAVNRYSQFLGVKIILR